MHGTVETVISVEVQDLSECADFAAALHTLTARALAPNVFYEPAFMMAAAPVFGRNVKVGLVWRGMPKQLIGFFPVSIERHRYGLPLPVLTNWVHPFAPLGMPLIDRDWSEAAVAAWLAHIAADPALPKRLLMLLLPPQGIAAFDAAVLDRGGRSAEYGYHVRALLRPDLGRQDYLGVAIAPKKRKELRRQRNRLAETGRVTIDNATEPPALNAALADFLTLEARGWKGRAGTAVNGNPALRRFIEEAVVALAVEGKASVARLALDDRAIAAIVTLHSGPEAWCWKIAYDETMARASPGVQLLLDVTQTLLSDLSITSADSCATPDHPMIDHVWRERLVLADRLMCVVPCSAVSFQALCALESLRHSAIDGVKALRNRLRSTRHRLSAK